MTSGFTAKKVVKLLEDMQDELNRDMSSEKAAYEKMQCWCNSSKAENEKALSAAFNRATDLNASIAQASMDLEDFALKQKQSQAEMDRATSSLQNAAKIREKDAAVFKNREKILTDALASVQNGLSGVLGTNSTLIQVKHAVAKLHSGHETFKVPSMLELQAFINDMDKVDISTYKAGLSLGKLLGIRKSLKVRKAAMKDRIFLQADGRKSNPDIQNVSGELLALKDRLQKDLRDARQAEADAIRAFTSLEAKSESHVNSAKDTLTRLVGLMATAQQTKAEASSELSDLRAKIQTNQDLLRMLPEKCNNATVSYERSKKDQHDEMAALEDAIEILSEDVSLEALAKPVNFFQISSVQQQASDDLFRLGEKFGFPRLSLLALETGCTSTENVTATLDSFAKTLSREAKDDAAKRDWCVDELKQNQNDTLRAEDDRAQIISDGKAARDSLVKVKAQVVETKQDMQKLQQALSKATRLHQAEHQVFQQTIKDQRLSRQVLQKAIKSLAKYYAFTQVEYVKKHGHYLRGSRHTRSPDKTTRYSSGVSVVAMLQKVLDGTSRSISDAVKAEAQAQLNYETLVNMTKKALEDNEKILIGLTASVSDSKDSLNFEKQKLQENSEIIEGKVGALRDLKAECRTVIEGFETRQEARATQLKGLQDAKALLQSM